MCSWILRRQAWTALHIVAAYPCRQCHTIYVLKINRYISLSRLSMNYSALYKCVSENNSNFVCYIITMTEICKREIIMQKYCRLFDKFYNSPRRRRYMNARGWFMSNIRCCPSSTESKTVTLQKLFLYSYFLVYQIIWFTFVYFRVKYITYHDHIEW